MPQTKHTVSTRPNRAPIKPLTIRPAGLASMLGVSTRHVTNLRNHPDPTRRLPQPFKIGRATFWRVADVEEWIDRQATATA